MTDSQRDIFQKILSGLEKSELVKLIFHQVDYSTELESTNDRLSEQNIEQQEELARLQQELAKAQRALHRQNAPFRREESEKKESPKPSGRKKGHPGSYRRPSGAVTEQLNVPLCGCPHCLGELKNIQPIKQIIEELPEPKVRIVELTTYQGYCPHCDKTIHSRHPLQVSQAIGAAGVQLGPRATAKVLKLHHHYGLTTRKISRFLEEEHLLPFTPGAVCHMEHRLAKKMLADYEQLLEQARQSEVLQGDETGWYVGRTGYYLFVLTNDQITLYDIFQSRTRDQLAKILGGKFEGIFVSDCLNMYDEVSERQHKCYAHHLLAVKNGLKILPNSEYLLKVKTLLQQAIKTKKLLKELKPPEYQQLCEHLEKQADELFPNRLNENGWFEFFDPQGSLNLEHAEQMVANRIARKRPHLFTFLYHENVPATNNLSERQLRPAIIQRKLSCGNKTEKGAMTWKIIRSILVSDNQNEKNFEESVFNAIQRDLVPR